MTTVDVVNNADPGNLAAPDLNLNVELRHWAVPYFYSQPDPEYDDLGGGVGYVQWRRKVITHNVNPGDTGFALPSDFWEMKFISFGLAVTSSPNLDFETDELRYIGEDAALVAQALQATQSNGTPDGYFFTGTPGAMSVNFDWPSDLAYVCQVVYYNGIVFADDTTSVDLAPFIPAQYQWALVELLRRRLYGFRFGIEDQRFAWAQQEAKSIINAARRNKEQSNQGKRARFCN